MVIRVTAAAVMLLSSPSLGQVRHSGVSHMKMHAVFQTAEQKAAAPLPHIMYLMHLQHPKQYSVIR